jgi:hypothetical protein
VRTAVADAHPGALGARIVIVPVETIVRLEAEDNYVRIWAERPFLHKETLTSLCSRLDPAVFLRVHRSHAGQPDARARAAPAIARRVHDRARRRHVDRLGPQLPRAHPEGVRTGIAKRRWVGFSPTLLERKHDGCPPPAGSAKLAGCER